MIKFKTFFLETALEVIASPYNTLQEVLIARDALFDIGKTGLHTWVRNTLDFIEKETIKIIKNNVKFMYPKYITTLSSLAPEFHHPTSSYLWRIAHIFNDFHYAINVCDFKDIFKDLKVIFNTMISRMETDATYRAIVAFKTIKKLTEECLLEQTMEEYCA